MLNSPPVPVPVHFSSLYTAWKRTRRGKKPSANQLAFEARWLGRLLELHTQLRAGTWVPRRTVSFVVTRPKTREIHAPDFADRVVHHHLVHQLEPLYRPVFIDDSHANQSGKGTHLAVARLQKFMRQRNGQGWFLQLDVANFFNTIHRPTLYALLCARLLRATRLGLLAAEQVLPLRSLCHKLLVQAPSLGPCKGQGLPLVPAHKRLANAKPGCGVPVGNLSSQFFANVVLNELDQFVKHTLKVHHYVRYVDDFVLLAPDPSTLQNWRRQIVLFLQQHLKLQLRSAYTLAPLSQGADFLGYHVRASHLRVRRRVVLHCCQRLQTWAAQHVTLARDMVCVCATPQALAQLQAVLASYWAHFAHAQTQRLRHALLRRFAWLRLLFTVGPLGQLLPRWVLQGTTLAQQRTWLAAQWPQAYTQVQRGCCTAVTPPAARQRVTPTAAGRAKRWRAKVNSGQPPCHPAILAPVAGRTQTPALASPLATARVHAVQTGWLKHGTRRREIVFWHLPLVCIQSPPFGASFGAPSGKPRPPHKRNPTPL